MNEKFSQLLKNIDLTQTQIKIYLCVLDRGLSTVLDIFNNTKINRSQIYFDTSILVERGILELAAKRKRKFLAIQPKNILKIIKEKNEKLKELENILDDANVYYETKNRKDENQFEIKIYEGISQVKKVFDFELDSAKDTSVLMVVGDIDHQHDFFSPEYWTKWNKQFTSNNSKGKMLIDANNILYTNFKENIGNFSFVTRGLNKFSLSSSFNIWKDYVLITTFSKKPVSVLIKNSMLAVSYREVFEQLWKTSK